jgi:hypothetical protein
VSSRRWGDKKEVDVDEEWTCGKGLALHSAIPAKFAELTAALVEILGNHLRALDPKDERAIPEIDAYSTLVREYGAIARDLEGTAARMAGYRDLPMAPHDEAAMNDRRGLETFKDFVKREQELYQLLQTHVAQDEEMLKAMT